MKIGEAREKVLLDFVRNTPRGAEELAILAISALPYSQLKTLTEGLDIEHKALIVKRKG